MYYVKKRIEVAGAHRLELDYESKCSQLHGHNWIITVWCRARELNANGMVVDFSHIKRTVSDALDHRCFNDVVDFNPTAENLARWICDSIPEAYRVEVSESANNTAMYQTDDCDGGPECL